MNKMTRTIPRAIQWSCFLLMIHSVYSQNCNVDCEKDNIGAVELCQNTISSPTSKGIVLVCVEVEDGSYQKAAICYNGDATFNKGAATAACRQKGYSEVNSYGPGSEYSFYHPTDVQYYIPYTKCPVVKNYSTEGETVLLRCSHPPAQLTDNITVVCPTSELAAVVCVGESLNADNSSTSYNGQISISSLPNLPEPIYPHINLDGQLLPICIYNNNPNFNIIGGSVCRQMGYTDVYSTSLVWTIEEAWYVGSLQCDYVSYSCFTECFDHTNYTMVSKCDDNMIGFSVTCIYNESNAGIYGSGSKSQCQIETTCSNGADERWLGVLYVVLAEAAAVTTVAVIFIFYKCSKRKKKNYEAITNPPER